MLEIKNMSIMIGTRYLVKSLNLTLNNGDKLAIIGEEGNGKSSILKAIISKCKYAEVTGNINFNNAKIGYLEQSINEENLNKKVFDFIFFNEEDYYCKVNNLYKYLIDLQIKDNLLEQKMNELSGGEKVKIAILKILLEEADILLLDEPTNDLDLETLIWLEKFINKTNKPLIYVSHDERLLCNTANMILHIEQLKHKTSCFHTLIKTDYNSYVENRLRNQEKQTQIAKFMEKEHNKKQEKLKQVMQKVEYKQNTITRSDPHGGYVLKKKMKSLKSQERRLEKNLLVEKVAVEEQINFLFEKVDIPRAKVILKLNLDKLMIDNKLLSKDINLEIVGNSKICIVGDNGVGKTTILKIVYNHLKTRTDLKVGYMPQFYEEELNLYSSALDFITKSYNKEDITKARMYLGNMNFTKEEMTGDLANLSNGSKAKLFLMKLVLDKCNVLILDEPTRNISPLSLPVICRSLKDYTGVIISVSHDRKYIEEVADIVYKLSKDGLKEVKGDITK